MFTDDKDDETMNEKEKWISLWLCLFSCSKITICCTTLNTATYREPRQTE